jgi:hypothetical protein
MLNIAGPEFDYGHVVFAVLGQCEHQRRSIEDSRFEQEITACAQEKLDRVKAAYEEFGGSAGYWDELAKEVLTVAVPQYAAAAKEMNRIERSGYGVFRHGDLGARLLFALIGLIIGSIIVALPWVPIFEDFFAFVLTAGGFFYPDLKRYMIERQYAKRLNRLVVESARYQTNAGLHYMTTDEIRESLQPGETSVKRRLPE